MEILDQADDEHARAAVDARASIPPALDLLILRCLAKEPGERPQSGGEVERELAAIFSSSSAPIAVGTTPALGVSTTLSSGAVEIGTAKAGKTSKTGTTTTGKTVPPAADPPARSQTWVGLVIAAAVAAAVIIGIVATRHNAPTANVVVSGPGLPLDRRGRRRRPAGRLRTRRCAPVAAAPVAAAPVAAAPVVPSAEGALRPPPPRRSAAPRWPSPANAEATSHRLPRPGAHTPAPPIRASSRRTPSSRRGGRPETREKPARNGRAGSGRPTGRRPISRPAPWRLRPSHWPWRAGRWPADRSRCRRRRRRARFPRRRAHGRPWRW